MNQPLIDALTALHTDAQNKTTGNLTERLQEALRLAQPAYTLLTAPFTVAEMLTQQAASGQVSGVFPVALWSLDASTYEGGQTELNAHLSALLTGAADLDAFSYRVVGVEDGNVLHLEVTVNAKDFLIASEQVVYAADFGRDTFHPGFCDTAQQAAEVCLTTLEARGWDRGAEVDVYSFNAGDAFLVTGTGRNETHGEMQGRLFAAGTFSGRYFARLGWSSPLEAWHVNFPGAHVEALLPNLSRGRREQVVSSTAAGAAKYGHHVTDDLLTANAEHLAEEGWGA